MSVWESPDNVAILRTQWVAGTMTRDIIAMIGGGVTRNAIVGKARRLGLGEHPYQVERASLGRLRAVMLAKREEMRAAKRAARTTTPPPPMKAAKAAKVYAPVEAPPLIPPAGGAKVLEFRGFGECAWPVSDDDAERVTFCCAKVEEGGSYCPHHTARLRLPGTKSRRPINPNWGRDSGNPDRMWG